MLWAYTGGAALIIGTASGWMVHGWKVDSDNQKALDLQKAAYEQKVSDANDENQATLDKLIQEKSDNVDLTIKLSAALSAASRPYMPIAAQIPAAIPKCDTDGSVRYDRSFVRLFNESANAGAGTTQSAAKAASDSP